MHAHPLHSLPCPNGSALPSDLPAAGPLAGEFKKRLNDDFNYSVTPLVFDLELKIDNASLAGGGGASGGGGGGSGEGWRILHVYGSPNPEDTELAALAGNGTIMRVREGAAGRVCMLTSCSSVCDGAWQWVQ